MFSILRFYIDIIKSLLGLKLGKYNLKLTDDLLRYVSVESFWPILIYSVTVEESIERL